MEEKRDTEIVSEEYFNFNILKLRGNQKVLSINMS